MKSLFLFLLLAAVPLQAKEISIVEALQHGAQGPHKTIMVAVNVSLPDGNSTVRIEDSETGGAEIFINDKSVGKTKSQDLLVSRRYFTDDGHAHVYILQILLGKDVVDNLVASYKSSAKTPSYHQVTTPSELQSLIKACEGTNAQIQLQVSNGSETLQPAYSTCATFKVVSRGLSKE